MHKQFLHYFMVAFYVLSATAGNLDCQLAFISMETNPDTFYVVTSKKPFKFQISNNSNQFTLSISFMYHN